MIKKSLKWSNAHETKLRSLFLKVTENNFNNKNNQEIFEQISKTFLDYLLKLNLKIKKLENINFDKHKEINKKAIAEVKNWSEKQKEYITSDKYNGNSETVSNWAKFQARNQKGNLYADFLREVVEDDTEYFQWETVGDNRVRDTHADLELEVLKFDEAEFLPRRRTWMQMLGKCIFTR